MKNHILIPGLLLIVALLACSTVVTTVTPSVPIAWPKSEPVNCRLGAGTAWVSIGTLSVGETATIQGRNGDSSWWYIAPPNDPGTSCWVSASVTNTAGNLAVLAVIPDPIASVTEVGVEVDPQEISVTGCVGPVETIEVTGSISTNGPLSVQYRFETQQGGEMAAQTIEFATFGTQTIDIDFTPSAEEGDFWIRLVIIQPGDQVAETTYHIDCTP
jgi:hypothetical protein